MTRFRFPLLCSALLLAGVAAAQALPVSDTINMRFYKDIVFTQMYGDQQLVLDTSIAYGEPNTTLAPEAYAPACQYILTQTSEEVAALSQTDPALRLVPGEDFRLLLVVSDKALPGAVADDGTLSDIPPKIPVAIDAAGNWVALDTNDGAKLTCTWLDCVWKTENSHADYVLVGDVHGVPNVAKEGTEVTGSVGLGGTLYNFSTEAYNLVGKIDTTDLMSANNAYVFLVVLDTRVPNDEGTAWACVGAPTRVSRYGIAYIGRLSTAPSIECNYVLSRSGEKTLYGNPSPVRPAFGVTSLTVDGVTLTGNDLDDYLKPMLATESTNPDVQPLPDGILGMIVYPYNESGLLSYALQTKANLSDPEWQDVAEWIDSLSEDERPSSGVLQGFDRIPADGKTPLVLPRLESETQRFYRLVAPGK